MNGSYPPDVQSLLDAGLVSFDGPVDMELHINGDTVVVVGTGAAVSSSPPPPQPMAPAEMTSEIRARPRTRRESNPVVGTYAR